MTKHVFMLWLVAAMLFVGDHGDRASLHQAGRGSCRPAPTNVLELVVEFIRDGVARPNLGAKWTDVWTPLLLTLFLFILGANLDRPDSDLRCARARRSLRAARRPSDSFLKRLVHGSSTATGNFNVTAGLAVVTFFAIIIAGTRAHGFVKHWINLVPHGLPKPIYVLLIPMEIIGMLVRPFALTMRLAANMTGGHIAILAIMSFVFIFAGEAGRAAGVGIGLGFSVPLRGRRLGPRDHRRARAGLRVHAACRPCSSAWPFTRITNVRYWRKHMQEAANLALAFAGAGIGLGLVVVGAGLGIGKLAAGVAEGVARQPSAAGQISGATNLPLFLLEGVAILAEVFCLLIVLKWPRSLASRQLDERIALVNNPLVQPDPGLFIWTILTFLVLVGAPGEVRLAAAARRARAPASS